MFDDSLPFSQPIVSVIKAAGHSHRFFSFSISIFFFQYFSIILLLFFQVHLFHFIFIFSSWFIIIIIIILVVKIFISFVIYILLTIKEKHVLFFFFKLQHKSGQILCENARSPYSTDDICYLEDICRTDSQINMMLYLQRNLTSMEVSMSSLFLNQELF